MDQGAEQGPGLHQLCITGEFSYLSRHDNDGKHLVKPPTKKLGNNHQLNYLTTNNTAHVLKE